MPRTSSVETRKQSAASCVVRNSVPRNAITDTPNLDIIKPNVRCDSIVPGALPAGQGLALSADPAMPRTVAALDGAPFPPRWRARAGDPAGPIPPNGRASLTGSGRDDDGGTLPAGRPLFCFHPRQGTARMRRVDPDAGWLSGRRPFWNCVAVAACWVAADGAARRRDGPINLTTSSMRSNGAQPPSSRSDSCAIVTSAAVRRGR